MRRKAAALGNGILIAVCLFCAVVASRSPDTAIFVAAALIIAAMPYSPKDSDNDR